LDALADRVKAPVTGEVYVNSERKNPLTFNKIAKYVQQEDHLIPILTVRQTFEFQASFYTTNKSLVKERVAEAIKLLGLEAQEHTVVGGALIRGLSGGQKRRVSIGCEVVAVPRIMFLDEPTSGLDSAAAWNVVRALKDIAVNKKTTLLLTIHQPSEKLFRVSDQFLLLSAGRSVTTRRPCISPITAYPNEGS
jgi:ABC-type multidrug transport system ATPase subunit